MATYDAFALATNMMTRVGPLAVGAVGENGSSLLSQLSIRKLVAVTDGPARRSCAASVPTVDITGARVSPAAVVSNRRFPARCNARYGVRWGLDYA